jgi:hypothetical protein
MPFPTSIQQFWEQAQQRGLFPLAIARGSKAPIGDGWNVWTHPIPHPGAGAVGLRCGDGGLSGFDCDNSDPETSRRLLRAFREVLGPDIPVRWGREPRFLIPYFLVTRPYRAARSVFQTAKNCSSWADSSSRSARTKTPASRTKWENWESDWPRITTAQLQHILAEVLCAPGRRSASPPTTKPPAPTNCNMPNRRRKTNGRQAATPPCAILACCSMNCWAKRKVAAPRFLPLSAC